MRVLQISSTYYPELQYGGPPQKIHSLSRGLKSRGHEVQVITFHSAKRYACQRIIIDGVEVQYLPWVGTGTRQVPINLHQISTAIEWADVIHCYGLYNLLCPAAAFLAQQLMRPYVLEPLGMYTPRARNIYLKKLYNWAFTTWLFRKAEKVIAASLAEIDDLSIAVNKDQLILRRNGIDLDLFQRLPSSTDFRVKHNISEDERVILYIGRISPIKNLHGLIQAFRKANLKQSRLVLVGPMLEPDYAIKLRTLINNLQLEKEILLTGPLYDREKLLALAAADLFVLPSTFESYGNAAAEAVAVGIPTLITNECGIAPIIHGRAGLAVTGTVDALAEGLVTMMCNSEKLKSLTHLQDAVRQELSWEEPLKQTIELYTSISHRYFGHCN